MLEVGGNRKIYSVMERELCLLSGKSKLSRVIWFYEE